jgi:hypothetical protein
MMPLMPTVIEYPRVLQTLTAAGLVSLYYNSGAFGFARETKTTSAGWILREDPTIRPTARELARVIAGDEATLAAMAGRMIEDQVVWVMPKSHWAYELDFGSTAWLPGVLTTIGVDAADLIKRHDGTALEFSPVERQGFEALVTALLTHLAGSDFMFVTADRKTICTIHHHKQLWWTSVDPAVIERCRVPRASDPCG